MCCTPLDLWTLAWGGLTFAAPLAPWAILFCAIPVVLHLVLRQKARRQVFPAMRLLAQAAPSGTRAHRLRRILLLACRVSLLGLLIALLGRPGCTPEDRAAGPRPAGQIEPASVVFCIDDSASMGYRFQGRSRFDHACDHARQLLSEQRRFAPGCQFAILAAAGREGFSWSPDPLLAARKLDTLHVGTHAQGVASLLQRGLRVLADARFDRQEIYLFTDLAAHAWRISPPPLPPAVKAVWIIDVGGEENSNMTLAWPLTSNSPWPADESLTLPIRLSRAGPAPEDATIELRIEDRPRHRQAVTPPPEGTAQDTDVPAGSFQAGLYPATFELQPADPLDVDNRRFDWIEVAGPPVVVLAHHGGEVPALLSAMIAPKALDVSRQRYKLRECNADSLGDPPLQGARAVLLADSAVSMAPAASPLDAYLQGGGTAILVPGPQTTPANLEAIEHLLPAPVLGVTVCTPPTRVAAVDLTHPFLQVFSDTSADSLNDRLIFRRLDLGSPADATTVLAPFADGTPAILERRLGKGRFLLLTFSPAREWSLFGSQAAPMIALLHHMLTVLAPPSEEIQTLTAGSETARWFPDLPDANLRLIEPLTSQSVTLPLQAGRVMLPTDRPGLYRLETGSIPARSLLHFSVNVAEAESDLARIAPDQVQSHFPSGLACVARPAELQAQMASRAGPGLGLIVPLGLLLLALLVAETLFSNRFYGRSR